MGGIFQGRYIHWAWFLAVFLGLYLTSLYSYAFFHSLSELFSVVIAAGIFILAWNSRRYSSNSYFLFIGITFLYIGTLDLIHAISYKGMGVFAGYDADLPTQLWIAARYMQGLSFLAAPFFLERKLKTNLVFAVYTAVTAILLLSIFSWRIFPACFIEGSGLTLFKVASEYIISFILLMSIALLRQNKEKVDPEILRLIIASVLVTVASEMAFTLYIDVYGFTNMIGHFLKIIAFYLIYRAIIVTGLDQPYSLLFRDLKLSEERFRELFDHMSSGVAVYEAKDDGKDFIIKDINQAGERISKVRRDEVVGHSVLDVFPGIENVGLFGVFQQTWRTGEARRLEESFYEDDRISLWVDNFVFKLPSGGIVDVYDDVTDRKQAEEALRKSEERFRDLYEEAPNAMFSVGTGGIIRRCNRRAGWLLGCPADILVGKPIFELYADTPDGKVKARHIFEQFRAGEKIIDKELQMQKADGTHIWVSLSVSPIRDAGGQISESRSMVVDITERKQLEAKLSQAHKMESLAQLSSGAAHEIRNPLHIMSLRLQMLEVTGKAADDDVREAIDTCHAQIIRITGVLDGLQEFSRMPLMEKGLDDLHKIIGRVVDSFDAKFKDEGITPEIRCGEDVPPLILDRDKISLVITHLISNAVDAMKDRETKRLDISTGKTPTGESVRIVISDTGHGIREADRTRIFNPFFTTKDPDKGKGLGLAVSYGIIRDHGGTIWAENNEQGGATFFIELPV